jgi:hypothetical protein
MASYDGGMPAPRRIVDLRESSCHECGAPLTWMPAVDASSASDTGPSVAIQPPAVSAVGWEAACVKCGMAYLTRQYAARAGSPETTQS